jgi:hypothetical protein
MLDVGVSTTLDSLEFVPQITIAPPELRPYKTAADSKDFRRFSVPVSFWLLR